MSLASEMRNISDCVRDCDAEFNRGYNKFIEAIRAKAREGKREISWYDNAFFYDFDNENRNIYLDMLDTKLKDNGFKHVYGYQIGKPIGSSMSQFVIW